MKPTIGRNVHYTSKPSSAPSEIHAAIVTRVHGDGIVDLTTFPPGSDSVRLDYVAHSSTPEPGCWNWPPRE